MQAPWMRFCKASCLSLEMYLLPIECEAMVTVCKAHNESSCAQEMCSSPGIPFAGILNAILRVINKHATRHADLNSITKAVHVRAYKKHAHRVDVRTVGSYAPCGGVIQAVDCNVAFDG